MSIQTQQAWNRYVPDFCFPWTVQGEMLCNIAQLRTDALEHGNSSWDKRHTIMAYNIKRRLLHSKCLTHEQKKALRKDFKVILKGNPVSDSGPYDRTEELIVQWCDSNDKPIPLRTIDY